MSRLVVETSAGPAWVELDVVANASILLLLGHGAGGGVDVPDLVAVRDACFASGISVARITQPYRVAGRRAPPAAPVLDRAWNEIVSGLELNGDVIFGGRSSGARVACRTASEEGQSNPARIACRTASDPGTQRQPIAVIALAFPLHPPGKPDKSRIAELDVVSVPVLVVQGARDPFGQPPEAPGRSVVTVPGDHSLRQSAPQVAVLVTDWITRLR